MAVKIINNDVRAALDSMPSDSVDCVVTSPPYWGLRDYGVDGQLGMEPTLAEHLDVMCDVMERVKRVLKPTGTLWLNYGDCYATTPKGSSAADTNVAGTDNRTFRDKPFSTVQGALKTKDLCMVPNRLAIALQEAGWWVRSEIIWAKPNPMPESVKDRPATSHEKIWLLTKSARYFYDSEAVRERLAESSVKRLAQDVEIQSGSARANGGRKSNGKMKAVGGPRRKGAHPTSTLTGGLAGRHETPEKYPEKERRDKHRGHCRPHAGFNERWDAMSKDEQQANGRNCRNVWTIATQPFSEAHFATFPIALAERCIKAGCPAGGLVLDPFGGSGTTGLAADRLRRDAILIELNPEYAAMARRRIEADAGMFAAVSHEHPEMGD